MHTKKKVINITGTRIVMKFLKKYIAVCQKEP